MFLGNVDYYIYGCHKRDNVVCKVKALKLTSFSVVSPENFMENFIFFRKISYQFFRKNFHNFPLSYLCCKINDKHCMTFQ